MSEATYPVNMRFNKTDYMRFLHIVKRLNLPKAQIVRLALFEPEKYQELLTNKKGAKTMNFKESEYCRGFADATGWTRVNVANIMSQYDNNPPLPLDDYNAGYREGTQYKKDQD